MDIYNPYVRTDIVSDTWQHDHGMNDFEVFQEVSRRGQPSHRHHLLHRGRALRPGVSGLQRDVRRGIRDPGYLSFDRLHPNNTGHRLIAELSMLGYAPLR